MGRRAIPKIDPQLDLSDHFRRVEDLLEAEEPTKLFSKVKPLEIEVGSGKGLFLQNAAQVRPEHNFLGIEVSYKYAKFCAARLVKRNIDNAIAIHGDALRYFKEKVSDASLEAVHVYFPDPWWKKRHRRRRVLNESFISDVVRTLKHEGRLHFWTDVQEYYDVTLELIDSTTNLDGPLPVPEKSAEHDLDYLTHFERRTRLNGEPVYRSEFVKP